MLQRRLLACALIYASVVTWQNSCAQNERAEYLAIPNPNNGPIWVAMLAHGRGARDRGWQPWIKIDANTTGWYRLQGYQPFDIYILGSDQRSAIRFNRVPLCSMMRDCETGRWRRMLQATRCDVEWAQDNNVTRMVCKTQCSYGGDADCRETFEAQADQDTVLLKDILFPGQGEPPPPPPGGPKR